ncbi:MAG: YheC/YheD family protein [Chloroflexota bacterium]
MSPDTIGVLVDRGTLRAALARRPSYENLKFYHQFARPGVCFFTFDGLRIADRRVVAYAYDSNNRLTRRVLLLPRVIHYRAIAFGKRDRRLARALLRVPGRTVFNSPWCGGKLRNIRWLAADPELRRHVPETLRYDGARSLRTLFARHPALILKPVWGSLGLGLIRVRRTASGYQWETGTSVRPHNCKRLASLVACLRPHIGNRSYLVQQALELATYQGRRFDVRVTVQRAGDGEWRVSGMVAKVGGHNRIATNVARGGRAVNLMRVLNASFGPLQAAQCASGLSSLGLRIAPVLARHEPGAADYGFDLCLTKDGHPWFLEANHRDLRYAFRDAGDHDLWANTYRHPMEYAACLLAAGRPEADDA